MTAAASPPPEDCLIEALAATSRGPKRNGIFALWLFTRVAEGTLPPDPLTGRAHRRRLEQLQRRLSSLSVPGPLRRALTAGLKQVGDGTPAAAALALQQLVAPARETLSSAVADAVAAASHHARTVATQSTEP